jgi:UDP-N-acetylmuramoyl-L-alanyl-D-glutamate--2,6-diaminopimelate ligase
MYFPFKRFVPKSLIHLFWHLPKAMLAALLYGFPGKKLTVIAVAGTKGKTSTAYFLSALLDGAGIKNCLFSTAALKISGTESLNSLKLTTPTPFFLQAFLRRALRAGCAHAVLEISSHAILQNRFFGVPLHTVIITNLVPDHLEYHATAKHYQETHFKLISPTLHTLVINGDDPALAPFHSLSVPTRIFTNNSSRAQRVREMAHSITGTFNIANASAALEAALAVGIAEEKLFSSLPTLQSAPGRMEKIDGAQFSIIVDYAHSVDSLKNFFSAIKPLSRGRIISVFGACGDRDKRMRKPMGEVLSEFSDIIIITNDDPYSEDPEIVAQAVHEGITKNNDNVVTILDRRDAIRHALQSAQSGDTVCILGKGAEQWQVFKNKKIPWDDRNVVREELVRLAAQSAQAIHI